MRTMNLAVALTLALGLAACAEDVDDPILAPPSPQTYTPVEYTHSATTPAPVPTENKLIERGTAPSFEAEVLEKPSIPQPSR